MKEVFFVLNGENQQYFMEQANAEKNANENGGELFQEEVANKRFEELKKQKGFFLDLPIMEVKRNGETDLPEESEDLKKMVEKLQAENDKLKKNSKLSYQDAAALFKKKGELLGHIGKFEAIQHQFKEVELKPTEKDELSTERYRIVLQGGYNYQKDEILAISNIFIISEFMEFTKLKVQKKIDALKAEVQEL